MAQTIRQFRKMECGSQYCVPESLHPYTPIRRRWNATGYDRELHAQFFQLAVDIKVGGISLHHRAQRKITS